MKSAIKSAIQASLYISLIALLGLLLALVYALLSLFAESAPQSSTASNAPLTSQESLPSAKLMLTATIYALPEAKEAPQLADEEVAVTDYAKMTTRELRPLARDRKIAKWNKLNKQELIAALKAEVIGD